MTETTTQLIDQLNVTKASFLFQIKKTCTISELDGPVSSALFQSIIHAGVNRLEFDGKASDATSLNEAECHLKMLIAYICEHAPSKRIPLLFAIAKQCNWAMWNNTIPSNPAVSQALKEKFDRARKYTASNCSNKVAHLLTEAKSPRREGEYFTDQVWLSPLYPFL